MLCTYKWIAAAKHEPPAQQHEAQGRDGKDDEVFGQDVDGVFALARPASTEANPRFMKNTRMAASRTQKVSIITVISTILSSLAAAAGRPSNDEGASPLGFAPLRTREGRRGYIRSALASWTQNSLFCRCCQPLGPFFMICAKSGPVFLPFLQDFI